MDALVIRDCMTPSPITIERHASVARALDVMRARAVHQLVVVEGGRVVGLIATGELHLLSTIAGLPLSAIEVDEVMSPVVYRVSAERPLEAVLLEMTRDRHRCAIVVDAGGGPLGVFTVTDALRMLVAAVQARAVAPKLHG